MDIASDICRSVEASAHEPAAIFFDVDGTLIWEDKKEKDDGAEPNSILPNASVYAAFERLHECGHQAYLCTGRPFPLISQGLLDLGFAGVIAGSGSRIMIGDKVVYESVIPRELAREAIRLLLAIDEDVFLESHRTPVMLSRDRETKNAFPGMPIACSPEEVEQLAPEMEFCKITSMDEHGPNWYRGGFERLIEEHFTECDMGLHRELSMKGIDKGSAVLKVLDLTGHGRANTYAFGDSENDFSMFAAVETPIAMGNAMLCAKERAAYVTGHAKGDGIAAGLEHFGLI